MNFLLAFYTLWQREVVRFFRQPARVVSAIAQPFLFWIFVGSGLEASFRPKTLSSEIGYLEFFYPGILLMIILFASIFSNFSVIEDREKGFFQGVLVSPAPRWSLVLSKVTGGATIALIQASIFLVLAPFIGIPITFFKLLPLILVLFLIGIALAGFGFSIAWRMGSSQGFHAVIMLILFPLWFLSGAFFPIAGLPLFLEWLVRLNPLTYMLSLIRTLFYGENVFLLPSLPFSLVVTLLFGVITLLISWYGVIEKRRR